VAVDAILTDRTTLVSHTPARDLFEVALYKRPSRHRVTASPRARLQLFV
jgi:hypothetical protein